MIIHIDAESTDAPIEQSAISKLNNKINNVNNNLSNSLYALSIEKASEERVDGIDEVIESILEDVIPSIMEDIPTE